MLQIIKIIHTAVSVSRVLAESIVQKVRHANVIPLRLPKLAIFRYECLLPEANACLKKMVVDIVVDVFVEVVVDVVEAGYDYGCGCG